MDELLTLSQCRLDAGIAERNAVLEGQQRDLATYRGEFERERRDRSREPGEHLRLVTFHVDLHERGRPVTRNQAIERRHRNANGSGPCLTLPATCTGGCLNEFRRDGRNGRIVA